MRTGISVGALLALVLILASTAEVNAQHTIRQAGQRVSYHSMHGGSSCGCSDCGSPVMVSHGGGCSSGCSSCCNPCLNLCLPNPCVVVDRVGTALHGLRELFRCRCCCDTCGCGGSSCCGVIQGEMPYLDHPHMMPPQPTTEVMPTPAAAARTKISYPNSPRVAAQAVRDQRYHRTVITKSAPAPRVASPVQRTSFKMAIVEEEAEASEPAPLPATPAAAAPIKKSDNPLR